MSKLHKDIKCERYICDFTGHDIYPGNVIGVGRAQGKNFEAYIVTGVSKNRVYFAGHKHISKKKLDANGNPVYKRVKSWNNSYYKHYEYYTITTLMLRQNHSHLSKSSVQEHVTLVQDPLFAINNPQIKQVIEIADKLKDEGLFPPDYKLGQTLVEYEEESTE